MRCSRTGILTEIVLTIFLKRGAKNRKANVNAMAAEHATTSGRYGCMMGYDWPTAQLTNPKRKEQQTQLNALSN